jgi:hypothetical protein
MELLYYIDFYIHRIVRNGKMSDDDEVVRDQKEETKTNSNSKLKILFLKNLKI